MGTADAAATEQMASAGHGSVVPARRKLHHAPASVPSLAQWMAHFRGLSAVGKALLALGAFLVLSLVVADLRLTALRSRLQKLSAR